MILGSGVDLVEIERIRSAVERHGERFLKRIFTPDEIRYSRSNRDFYPHLAARFAAKEAVVKAMGNGFRAPVSWRDIEVSKDIYGRPGIILHNHARDILNVRNEPDILVSISHTKNYAIASVIVVGEKQSDKFFKTASKTKT